MVKEVFQPDPLTREVTIYALTDPDSGEVRYIGQTVNLRARVCQHLSNSPSDRCGKWM